MYAILNRYLFLNKSIPVPGLGTICMESQSATPDASTRSILPPTYRFRFDKFFDSPDKELFAYLSSEQHISDYEALRQYNDFAFSLRDRLNYYREAPWEGLGILKKDDMGDIHFETSIANPFFLQPVPAEKVVRANAKHMLLVGDRERSNREMSDWFAEEPVHGNKLWWLVALLLGIAAAFLILFHFSSHGWSVESTGNQQLIQVKN
ncbi:MAG TPA: hypothetical protein DIC22_08035 [Chitinophagaceae bacterium]|jgi:hypothetical protein|nr:hypothetical protein [Chitinophagaceae bacterium]